MRKLRKFPNVEDFIWERGKVKVKIFQIFLPPENVDSLEISDKSSNLPQKKNNEISTTFNFFLNRIKRKIKKKKNLHEKFASCNEKNVENFPLPNRLPKQKKYLSRKVVVCLLHRIYAVKNILRMYLLCLENFSMKIFIDCSEFS